ncbi:alpha-sarcoglycan isoform X2 [Corvus moneduloides]|uniref:alpha-sarcoglycan isoform X2 n=1 Tax=Corvus moneduloides TaxID=1196302 RepID=UPI001363CAFE|nr:alpha-sarcoglycan isoform X2 [Corvus moneduloides]
MEGPELLRLWVLAALALGGSQATVLDHHVLPDLRLSAETGAIFVHELERELFLEAFPGSEDDDAGRGWAFWAGCPSPPPACPRSPCDLPSPPVGPPGPAAMAALHPAGPRPARLPVRLPPGPRAGHPQHPGAGLQPSHLRHRVPAPPHQRHPRPRWGRPVPGRVPGGEQERGGAAAGGGAGDVPAGLGRGLGAGGPAHHQRHLCPGPRRPRPTAHRGAPGGGVRPGGLPQPLLAVPGVGRVPAEPLPLSPGPASPRLLLRHLRPPLLHPLVQPHPAAGLAQPHDAGAAVGVRGAGGRGGFRAPHRGCPPGAAARVPGDAAGAAGGGRAALPAPGPPHVLPQGGSGKTGLADI